MKKSGFTFTVKAICCAFLFGIVQVGCEKPQLDDGIKADDQYINPTPEELDKQKKQMKEDAVALEPEPPK